MEAFLLYFALIFLNILFSYSLDPSTIVLAINAAGTAYTSPLGFSYSDDNYYTSGSTTTMNWGSPIARTVNDVVYYTERWYSGTVGYNLPVSTDGNYVLILQFAEIYWSAANKRIFNIQIGSYVVASNLDLYATVGALTAYDIFVAFTLSSGTITINGNTISGAYSGGNLLVRLISVKDNAKISAIILVKGDCTVADYCNMCYQTMCMACNVADLTCTTCITNASPVSGVCQCNAGTLWVAASKSCVSCDNLCISCSSVNFICGACSGTNVLVSSVCLRACPYGFGASCASVSTAVIDQNFADYFYGAYGLFQTGTSSSFYYFFNTPETIDPIPAKSRGLYFSGGSYLQTTSAVYISLNFSIGIWVWILSGSGDILTNSSGNKIKISANGVMTIVLESITETTTTVVTGALNPSNTAWAYISFIISFSSSTISTTVVPYLNNSPQTSISSNGNIYRDATSNILILGKSSSSNFLGYIYQFTLYNVAVSDFNNQYLNQICGSGAMANCLWTCPLSQWMDGAAPTNCNSCANGCVRSVSCNVCYDPLCSKCSGFLTGLCSQCVSNASGTPCTCNIGYMLSADGFSCMPCYTGCAYCTGTLYYQCSSCLSSYYLLKTLCLSYCPSGYTADSTAHSCTLSASNPLSIALQNLIQLDTVSGVSVGSSNTNKYPSWETTDPIPSIYRGYYFSENNYMSLASFTISPYFSLLIWVKPLNDGYLFMKFDGTKKYCYITFTSGIPSMNIILADANSFSVSGSSSILSAWHYLSFTGELSSGNTVINLSIDAISVSSATSPSSSYYKDLGALYIGKDSTASGGFTGFLWSLKIYNDNTYASQEWITSGCPTVCTAACPSELKCPDSCPFGQFYSTSCISCTGSCPYGCRSTLTCRLCKDKECAACTAFDGPCTSCITNASPSGTTCVCNNNAFWEQSSDGCQICDNLCSQCQTNNYFLCTSCGAYTLVSGVCLRSCPYGFTSPCVTVTSPVIDAAFNGDFQGTYSVFTTGTSSSSYQFFNSPEAIDPIPAKQRGLYFNGSQYLISNTDIYLSHSFAMGLWIYVISSEDILTNSRIIVASSGSLNIPLESPSELTSIETLSSTSFTLWKYLSFTCSFSSSTIATTLTIYNDNNVISSLAYNTLIYRDQANNKIKIGGSSSSYFTGFIYSYQLWNVAVFDFTTQLGEICGSGLLATCLWTCDINNYFDTTICKNCDSGCTLGCTRTGSCNICDDPLCSICSGFDANKCSTCVSHAHLSSSVCICDDGYYWDLTIEECSLCDSTCKTCTSSASGDCIVCATGFYMYLGWCISKCPDGFIASGSVCIENDTFIFYLSFDTLEGVVFDKQSKVPALTGNSTAFYPDYDEFDPLAASYRGFYFNGINSLMHLPIYPNYTSPILSFGYAFTFSLWINVESNFGTIISKQDKNANTIFSVQLSAGVVMISLNFKDSGVNNFFYLQSLDSYLWNHIAIIAEYTNVKQTKMSFYLNGVVDNEIDMGYDYFKDTKTDISFTLGAAKDSLSYSNYFKGFIYDIKGYNSVKNILSLALPMANCLESCNACLTTGVCIPNCLISQYWIGPQYNKCSECSSECSSCKDSSKFCNLCYNPKCTSCLDFSSDSCLNCTSGSSNITNCQCDYGLAWNSSSGVCEVCHQWQYKANDTCYDCPSLCAQCDDEDKCTSCINNAVLDSGKCTCAPGYLGNTSCIYVPFNVTLTVNLNNTLILSFSDFLITNLTSGQIYIEVLNQTIESFSVTYLSNSSYLISCDFGGGVKKGTIVKVCFFNPTEIASVSGGVINDKYLSGSLYKSIKTAEEQEIMQIQNQVSAGVKVLAGLGAALAMLNSSPSGFWTILNTIQLLSYIPYANYPLTDKIIAFFEAMNSFNFVPNVFSLFIDKTQGNGPYYQAKRYGYDNDLILINIGNDVTIICSMIAMMPIIFYLSKCSERFLGKKLKKIYNDYKFGVFLRFWIMVYLESGFAAIVGILSASSSEISPSIVEFTNLLMCWACIIMILITPFLMLYWSYKNANNIIYKKNRKWLIPWNSLFYEFKNDLGFMSTQYYTLFFTRRLIFIAVQVFLNDFPQSQLTINTVCALCIALYVFVYKPFEDPVLQITNLITECGISITFIMITPYFFDHNAISIDAMDNCIIFFIVSLMVAQSVSPLINCIKDIYYIAKRSISRDTGSLPIKSSNNAKRINLNKLTDFFENETPANMPESIDIENQNSDQDLSCPTPE